MAIEYQEYFDMKVKILMMEFNSMAEASKSKIRIRMRFNLDKSIQLELF